ncbi:hypothetical protein BIY24_10660 [Halobacteriovorax marinus]|uniref:Transport-related membrane protein n=1 Tax=Halobacteriovorax marinus (strain ATCC BAA-682 / DSM 15412 / SJ) TaxID=862908 RepID=E1X4A9_HALMS|nr:potassium channel family protein [Halobacteriovorax marinus]ATH08392.1 hypothetical protein BIY24_10660 [Halobacteriovorax marinus]CBW27081.1 putative transport-related membrane protein [Halobacteriovorax marinus SJ]
MITNNNKIIFKRIMQLVTSVEFIAITIFGNLFIFLCSIVIYFIEGGSNPNMNHFIDAVWWCFSTVTSVGYGDVVPVTITGKIFGIFLMLLGTAIFAIYTALFANAVLGDYTKRFRGLYREISTEEEQLSKSIEELKKIIDNLEAKDKK